MSFPILFFGQIGVNSTAITLALEEEDFELAEVHIKETEGEYLDDGPYENIPLKLVLSNNKNKMILRNLYLAKLLVERGANPNILIPHLDMDGAFSSPFQDLVVYYEKLRDFVNQENYFYNEDSKDFCSLPSIIHPKDVSDQVALNDIQRSSLTSTIDLNGLKCENNFISCLHLLGQTRTLIDIFMRNGADPNVLTTFSNKSLFHWISERDKKLAITLLESSKVNCNLCDFHANSPLMNVILKHSSEDSLVLYESMREWSDTLDVNCFNCYGENAFALACFTGSPSIACSLQKFGAEFDYTLSYNILPFSKCCRTSGDNLFHQIYQLNLCSPILCPLVRDSPVYSRYTVLSGNFIETPLNFKNPHKNLIDKIIHSSVSPVIDSIWFDTDAASQVLSSLLNFTAFYHLQTSISLDVILPLMFGYLTSGLQQLCIRTILDCIYHSSKLASITENKNSDMVCVKACKNSLKASDIQNLVSRLGLPPKLCHFFELEVAKYQACHMYMFLQRGDCASCTDSSESLIDEDETEMFDSSESYASSDYEESHPLSSDLMSDYSSSVSSEGLQLSDDCLSRSNDSDGENKSSANVATVGYCYEKLSPDSASLGELETIPYPHLDFIIEEKSIDSDSQDNESSLQNEKG